MSKTPMFTKLFGPSPIAPIQQHMTVCEECAAELEPFVEAVLREDWLAVGQYAARVAELENKADEIKKSIRMKLPRSLFLPVSRNNLLELLHVQDQIANAVQDVTGLIIGRRMCFPEGLHPLLLSYVQASKDAVRLAGVAMDELNDLLATGFSMQEIDFIENILERLHLAEHKSDELQVEVRQKLFSYEKDLDSVDVMFMYKIIDLIGDMADRAQTVGNRMMYLIAS